MTIDPQLAQKLFLTALEIADSAARREFLARECAGDVALRQRVEALLSAHNATMGFDVDPSGPPLAATNDAPAVGRPDALIAGRYKLRQQIGEGGMGTVWMADQTSPVKRKVAVKLIRVERGQSKMILARFEAERQAIALMDHPHIAKLLDAGTTDDGSPFFVMELVKGIPLNEFCDQHRLTVQERLTLFLQICSAVQHAHQKGIIHRDLKPSNILVESHDGKPVPKVIDFGLAKATTGLQLTDQSMFTAFGSVMGTPLYMAPEQANFNAVDVDTRADVYALGIILYELLTGTTPITRDTLKKAALDEMMRLVREQEAPKPSSRLSSADSAPNVAASRQMELAKLGRFVKGELDWIVLKALSKERDRRYETANGFARDIERFMNHEPVSAGPPSTRYRLQKFVQRNRGQVIAASLVLCALLAGIAGTTVGLFEAKRQERLAVAAADEERNAKDREAQRAEGERLAKLDAEAKKSEAQQAQARAEAGEKLAGERLVQVEAEKAKAVQEQQIAQAVKDFLQTKLLAQADTTAQANQLLKAGGLAGEAKLNPTIRELLDRAAKELAPDKIEANFPDQPLVQAEILRTVGGAYLGVGEAATAIPFLIRSVELLKARLGPEHPDTLVSMHYLAQAYKAAGKLDLALPLFEETLKHFKARLGPEHPDTLVSMHYLAQAYKAAGKLDLALPLFEETLKHFKARLGPDHPNTLASMGNLAGAYQAAGKLDLALPLFEETLKLKKAKLGPDHPDTLSSMNGLASAYQFAGKLDLALPLHEETLKLKKAKLGPDHPSTLTSINNLAGAYRTAGKLDLALPLFEEALKLREAKLGPDHPHTLGSINNLARAYQDAGKLDLALPLHEETLKFMQAKLGLDHPDTLYSMGNLAQAYQAAGKLDLPLFEETLKLTKARLGPDHPDTLTSMHNLAAAYHAAGKNELALPLFEETLKLMKAKLGPDHPDTLISMVNLGKAYCDAKQVAKAAPLLSAFITAKRKGSKPDDPGFAGLLAQVSLELLKCEQFATAEEMLRESLVIREKTQPDVWTTFNTLSMLGRTLVGQMKYAEAEPLLLKGYEGLKARETSIPPEGGTRIPEALDRLIELFTATNKPDEVTKWQAERSQYPPAATDNK